MVQWLKPCGRLESTADSCVFNSGFWRADLLKWRALALTPCTVLVCLDLQDNLVKCPKQGSHAWCLFLDSCQPEQLMPAHFPVSCSPFHLWLFLLVHSLVFRTWRKKVFFPPFPQLCSRCDTKILCSDPSSLPRCTSWELLGTSWASSCRPKCWKGRVGGSMQSSRKAMVCLPPALRGRLCTELHLRSCPSSQQQMQHVGEAWFTSFHHV